eukprot:s274_g18.t4
MTCSGGRSTLAFEEVVRLLQLQAQHSSFARTFCLYEIDRLREALDDGVNPVNTAEEAEEAEEAEGTNDAAETCEGIISPPFPALCDCRAARASSSLRAEVVRLLQFQAQHSSFAWTFCLYEIDRLREALDDGVNPVNTAVPAEEAQEAEEAEGTNDAAETCEGIMCLFFASSGGCMKGELCLWCHHGDRRAKADKKRPRKGIREQMKEYIREQLGQIDLQTQQPQDRVPAEEAEEAEEAEAFGAALKLGFSKVAIYEAEAELAAHRDQILNEVSITLVLEDTAHGASSPSWPLELLRPPEEAVFDKDWHVVSLHAAIGEALLFRGRDFLHSRPCCLGRGQRSLVLLLHYVPASFPEYHCVTLVNVSTSTVDELLNYQCSTVISPELHEAKLAGERPAQQPPVGITTPDPRTRRYRRYMLYNPCATNFDPSYCQSQFNNQVVFFLHALSVAKCLGRTLVLPPFMWMEHQMAETQHWFPFEHFFDLQTLKARFDVIPLEEFLDAEGLRQPGGKKLQWYLYPPYMVNDAPFAFRGLFFEKYMNLSFAMPKRMSPFWEARMGKSGRGEEPFRANEGHSYWTAVRLLLGKLRAESSQLHSKEMKEDSWFARWIPGAPMEQKEAALIARQSEEVEQMKASLGSLNLGPGP